MRIWYNEEISITGKSLNQRVYLKLGMEGYRDKPLCAVAADDGEILVTRGHYNQRAKLKEWCLEELGDEKPPFAILFDRVKSLHPKPVNPKTPAWLR